MFKLQAEQEYYFICTKPEYYRYRKRLFNKNYKLVIKNFWQPGACVYKGQTHKLVNCERL